MTTTLTPAPAESKERLDLRGAQAQRVELRSGRHDLTLAYRLCSVLIVVAAIAAAVGVFHPAVFRDTAMTAGNARGTDLVILIVALPAVLISMALAMRGSLRAQIVWLGALSYILYNSVFFAYAAAFNELFLVYVATLSLAAWSLLALLLTIDVDAIRGQFAATTPVRAVATYLLVTTVLFALVWLKDIVPALIGNTIPDSLHHTRMLTNAVQVTDLAFYFPATILSAVWLWQRRAWGYLLAGAFLVYGVIEAISVTTDQTFGHISDPTQSTAMVPVFAVLIVIALIPLAVYFRNMKGKGSASS